MKPAYHMTFSHYNYDVTRDNTSAELKVSHIAIEIMTRIV